MSRTDQAAANTRIREGFPKQRLVVLPANVLERCRAVPMVSELHVTDIGLYPSAPHHYVERKQGASQAILIYCLAGKGTLWLAGNEHPVRPGHVMVIPPAIPHVYQADKDEPWSIFWIHFSGRQTHAVLQSLGIDIAKPLLFVSDFSLMRQAFEEVYACLSYHHSDAGLLAMTSELMRLLSKIKLHQGHLQPQRQSAENRVIEILDFMHRHLDLPLTLEELATRSGQSIPYFCKLFKERTNQSPMAWFTQLKVQKACELLDQTDLSVQGIGQELGYDDPYYFSRLFKKVQGCSPTAYRRTVKG